MNFTQRATMILMIKSKEWAVSVELTYSLFSFGIKERKYYTQHLPEPYNTHGKVSEFPPKFIIQTFHGTVQNFCDEKVLPDIENLPIIRILSCFYKNTKIHFKNQQLHEHQINSSNNKKIISECSPVIFSLRSKMNLSWIKVAFSFYSKKAYTLLIV